MTDIKHPHYVDSATFSKRTMALFIQKHRPLITSRIKFKLAPLPPLPAITPRIEFTPERLAYSARQDEADGLVGGDGSRATHNDDALPRIPQINSNLPNTDNTRPKLSPLKPAGKIPKPPGEPGRPKSGGHCVETALVEDHGWAKEDYDALTVSISKMLVAPEFMSYYRKLCVPRHDASLT